MRWGKPASLLELWQNGSATMGASRFLKTNAMDMKVASKTLFQAMSAEAREAMLVPLTWEEVQAYNESNTAENERPAGTFMALDFGDGDDGLKYMDLPTEISMDWVANVRFRLSVLRLEMSEAVPNICSEGGNWEQTITELHDPEGFIPGRYAVIQATCRE